MPENDPLGYYSPENFQKAARELIRLNGLPPSAENVNRAQQAVYANPQLLKTMSMGQEQVNYSTGKSSLPEMYLGVDDRPAASPGSVQSQQPSPPAAPGDASIRDSNVNNTAQGDNSSNIDDISPNDEFEQVSTNVVPLPIVAPANNVDTLGMDIEGTKGIPGLPPPNTRETLSLPAPGPNNRPPSETIIPPASFAQRMDAQGTDVLQASPNLSIYRNKRTGKTYQVNQITGEVLDEAGKALNSSAAKALLRVVRR